MQKLEAKLKKRSKSYDVKTDSQKIQRPCEKYKKHSIDQPQQFE